MSHTVGLYDYNGGNYTLVAEATVAAGSAAGANGYAWISIPAVTLTDTRQGADYYIVMASEGTDVWAPFTGSAHTTQLDFNIGAPTGNGWFTNDPFPVVGGTDSFNPAIGNGGYFGPNIGEVPEPSSIVALIGLCGMGLILWTKRRKSA